MNKVKSGLDGRVRRALNRLWVRPKAGAEAPPRAVLVIACAETAGDWLATLLRCHPGLELSERPLLHRQLGLTGPRWTPAANPGEAHVRRVEQAPGRWVTIPARKVPRSWSCDLPPFELERVEPRQYGSDGGRLARRLSRMQQAGTVLKPVLVVEHPFIVLRRWYRRQEEVSAKRVEAACRQVERRLHGKLELLRTCQGLAVEHGRLLTQPAQTLQDVLQFIWPQSDFAHSEAGQGFVRAALRGHPQPDLPLPSPPPPMEQLPFHTPRLEPLLADCLAHWHLLLAFGGKTYSSGDSG